MPCLEGSDGPDGVTLSWCKYFANFYGISAQETRMRASLNVVKCFAICTTLVKIASSAPKFWTHLCTPVPLDLSDQIWQDNSWGGAFFLRSATSSTLECAPAVQISLRLQHTTFCLTLEWPNLLTHIGKRMFLGNQPRGRVLVLQNYLDPNVHAHALTYSKNVAWWPQGVSG